MDSLDQNALTVTTWGNQSGENMAGTAHLLTRLHITQTMLNSHTKVAHACSTLTPLQLVLENPRPCTHRIKANH